ncbi:hypothetical protein [Pandoraea cepalis]|uniref:hypothetical protein n=1 Tax=Pandoraea cepalis TaxID=2508294 RepID=UPI001FE4FE8C|nr:hypothetical protein [Pandoraea cepalis]
MTTLIDCGVSLKGTDDFVTWASAGMSNAVRGAPLALTDTAGSATVPDALMDVASGVAVSAFVALTAAELATSVDVTCAKASGDAAMKTSGSAA